MNKWILAAALIVACGTASAGNDSCNNRCGDDTGVTNNGGSGFGGSGYGGDGGAGVGVGVGVGLGGSATATGGEGGKGGAGGSSYANGGDGGSVIGSGNSANLNNNDATAISGSVSGADSSSSAVSGSNSGATSSSGGNSITNGPTTVGGQAASNSSTTNVSYRTERNAPPVYLGNVAATVSCAGGFSAGSSSQGGAGALGFNWISPDCKTVVAGQNLQSLGMVDVACRVFKTTDGFKRAAKRDPSLNNVDCSIAK